MHRPFPIAMFILLLVGCGSSGSATTGDPSTSVTATTTNTSAPTTAETSPASTTTEDDNAEVPRIKVEDGVKTEGLDILSVRVGETVRFEVEADVADEVHVHSYDLTFETIPNQEVLVEFVANVTGIFEVELEGLGLLILDIEVTP
jgi:plastocyanin